jgi:hypothetical protein
VIIDGVDFSKPERGLTISTVNKTKRKDILKIIHRSIMKCGKRKRGDLDAYVIGECLMGESSYSRSWHIVFSDDLMNEERIEIEKAINSSENVIGRKNITTRWRIYNTDLYVFKNEKHTYFKKERII